MKIKYYVVTVRKKIDEDWASIDKTFHTRDEVMDYIDDSKVNYFTVRVARDMSDNKS